MVTLRSKAPVNLDCVSAEEQHQPTMEREDAHQHTISEYELSREERIRENRERMEKLGIFSLSQKLNTEKPNQRRAYHRKVPKCDSPLQPSGPVRRSGRLQNSTPVSYCEVDVAKRDKYGEDILSEVGSKPEVYTEEHEKLLGSTEMIWTPFVDGYGKDGKRIYDPIKGKTCHQCRQKTLGHRTSCSKCDMVQGQFCGDCLYMRYGENVLEAKANPDWICPVCRGICNCSLCRQAKGWPPTGSLYRKISNLGFKSVAHYLIQTRNATAKCPPSAKRSLPFKDSDVKEVGEDELSKPISESLNDPSINEPNKGSLSKTPERSDDCESLNGPSINEPNMSSLSETLERSNDCEIKNPSAKCPPPAISLPFKDSDVKEVGEDELSKPISESLNDPSINEPNKGSLSETPERSDGCESLNDPSINEPNKSSLSETLERSNDCEIKNPAAIEKTPNPTKKRVRHEPNADTVAGRLRQRRNKAN